jgi:hypothetical protein
MKEFVMLPTPVVAAVLAPLVLWRVYSRIKRLTTRQRSKTWRHRTTLVFFPLLLLLLAAASLQAPIALAGMGAGLAVGVILGRIGSKGTRFEQQGDEYYFTPHAPIGMLVALLFLGRMGYRAYQVLEANGQLAHHEFVTSPLTLCIFGVLAGYYMTFAAGLLAWRKRTAAATAAAPATAQ